MLFKTGKVRGAHQKVSLPRDVGASPPITAQPIRNQKVKKHHIQLYIVKIAQGKREGNLKQYVQ
jgi:hypothetical protein